MPANFPEVWQRRVERNLSTAVNAPWLEGIPELDVDITVMGEGSASEQNIIHIPTTDFEPDVLINNTAYPLAIQEYTDNGVIIQLDKYQPKAVSVTDDQVIGAAYSRIDAATGSIVTAITKKKYAKAIHSLAPADHSANTPVLNTTGEDDGTGRLRLRYEDLVSHKDQYDGLELDMIGRRLVLCTDHWNDLLLDRKRFGDHFANYRSGNLAPMVAGFELFQYVANPYFSGTEKNAFGEAPSPGDKRGSVSFCLPNVARKTGFTKQYYRAASTDPEYQRNLLGYRHYFICVPKRLSAIGAIVSGNGGEG